MPSSPLIFVHGFKGAQLVAPDGKLQWLTRGQAMGFGNASLALPMHWNEDGTQGHDNLRPGAILESLYLLPRVLGEDIYTPWLNAVRRSSFAFHPFAYDWRRDPLETLGAMAAFVQHVRAQHGGNKVRLVAHSLGGLLALALLNQRSEDFSEVTFVGVPFAGGIGFLRDLSAGTRTGMNKRLLSPGVLGTYPSVYAFFPLDGHGLVNAMGDTITENFFAAETWIRHGWGLFTDKCTATDAAAEFLAVTLRRARRFRTMLAPNSEAHPPIKVVFAKHVPTVRTARLRHHDLPDFDVLPKVDGDDRVPACDALPPPPLAYTSRVSSRCHAELLNDPDIANWVLAP